MTKIAHHLQEELANRIRESVEKGTDPEKSLKRKREEQDQLDFQVAKAEMEKKKKEEEEERLKKQVQLVIHPFTGDQMWLNYDQRVKFFQDLPLMSADQFPPKGAGKGSMGSMPPIPPSGFPPHMPQRMVYGQYSGSGTPATPSAPIAPATLPVLSGTGNPENTTPGLFAYGGKSA